MRWIYPLLLWLAVPLVWLRLQWRSRREPAYAERRAERFGAVPEAVRSGPVWFHTVSAGESIAAAPLIAALAEQFADLPFLVTTMTPTGSQQVLSRLGGRVDHCYAPYDFTFAVERFYRRVQPRMLVLMETELWPNLIARAHQRNVPVLMVNARLSARSARGYARISSLTLRMMRQVEFIACQTEAHRQRFISLGADADSVEALGSVKFDVALPDGMDAQVRALAAQFGLQQQRVWIAASTHPGEDEIVLDSFQQLRRQHPRLRLVLVPRHPNRAQQVAELARRAGYSVQLQSEGAAADSGADVLLGDVMGTLLQLYGLAEVAFVGGSLVDVGGHNPIEPALFALPVLSGPRQYNFTDVFAQLDEAGGVETVADAVALAEAVSALLADENRRRQMGQAALATVQANRGATKKVTDLLSRRIAAIAGPETGAVRPASPPDRSDQ